VGVTSVFCSFAIDSWPTLPARAPLPKASPIASRTSRRARGVSSGNTVDSLTRCNSSSGTAAQRGTHLTSYFRMAFHGHKTHKAARRPHLSGRGGHRYGRRRASTEHSQWFHWRAKRVPSPPRSQQGVGGRWSRRRGVCTRRRSRRYKAQGQARPQAGWSTWSAWMTHRRARLAVWGGMYFSSFPKYERSQGHP
jgi:hypothetical protein